MRVVFLYVSWKHGFGEGIYWNPCIQSDNYFADRFEQEGYASLLNLMVESGIVDEAICFIESKSSTGAFKTGNIEGYVAPSIVNLREILKPGDVIWVRGAWKHWYDILIDLQNQGHWLLLYAANTGRQRWDFWDVIFDDIGGETKFDEHGRLLYDFRKPLNESIFYLKSNEPIIYDVMIGASRIHDKKGQWKAINMLIEHDNLVFNGELSAFPKPRVILPGPIAKGVETNKILSKIIEHNLNVEITGELERERLAQYMNRTRLLLAFGSHGQGDRGPMEAMACGCEIALGYPQYHASWLSRRAVEGKTYVHLMNSMDDYKKLASEVDLLLSKIPSTLSYRHEIAKFRIENSGLYGRCLPDMNYLFKVFRRYPIREPGLLQGVWE